eukprot:CAMPEP_0116031734 /NCGR_PEP_ID=MMETSP0321-20121206/17733_1 /TAXON_ID=163516 /ORGANISM="Leptocylindrus danicus var. danicus, Strain B650" /LENGTH=953 /DNA_ID=CAMNT_0003507001 /DNA_START=100 /DNA_END=2962 /DNA_ORIENTATION=+
MSFDGFDDTPAAPASHEEHVDNMQEHNNDMNTPHYNNDNDTNNTLPPINDTKTTTSISNGDLLDFGATVLEQNEANAYNAGDMLLDLTSYDSTTTTPGITTTTEKADHYNGERRQQDGSNDNGATNHDDNKQEHDSGNDDDVLLDEPSSPSLIVIPNDDNVDDEATIIVEIKENQDITTTTTTSTEIVAMEHNDSSSSVMAADEDEQHEVVVEEEEEEEEKQNNDGKGNITEEDVKEEEEDEVFQDEGRGSPSRACTSSEVGEDTVAAEVVVNDIIAGADNGEDDAGSEASDCSPPVAHPVEISKNHPSSSSVDASQDVAAEKQDVHNDETCDGGLSDQKDTEVVANNDESNDVNDHETKNGEQRFEDASEDHHGNVVGEVDNASKVTAATQTPADTENILDKSEKLEDKVENKNVLSQSNEDGQVVEEESKNDEALMALSEENEILKAELESARSMIIQFEEKQKVDEKLIMELQQKMTVQMTARAEAEDKLKQVKQKFDETSAEVQKKLMDQIEATTRVEEQLNTTKRSLAESSSELDLVKTQLESAETCHEKEKTKLGDDNRRMNTELTKARKKIEEFEMDTTSLTARLNEAKKIEASKAREAARSAEKCTALQDELEILKNAKVKGETLQAETATKMKTIEDALEKERQLNATRKAKMKQYVEVQSSEIKSLKATNARLTNEVGDWKTEKANILKRSEYLEKECAQSTASLKELQEENIKLRTNSEKLSKVGGDLEKETEDLKKKRLTAKHETMTLLRSLEVERAISSKLQHELKFTLLPKALSQQELLSESLKVLEGDLELLTRTKFVNQVSQQYTNGGDSYDDTDGKFEHSEDIEHSNGNDANQNETTSTVPKQQAEYLRLLNNLEDESKKVSLGILALTSNVDRLHELTVNDINSASTGDRSCVSALSGFLMGVSNNTAPAVVGSGAPVLSPRRHAYANVAQQNTQ